MKKLFVIASLAVLSACAAQVKTVEVPVYSCPPPEIIPEPSLEVERLDHSSPDYLVLRAYGRDLPVLISYANALKGQLKVYADLSKRNGLAVESDKK